MRLNQQNHGESRMNTKDVERLIALIENTDITEVEFQTKDDRIRITRTLIPDGADKNMQTDVFQQVTQPQVVHVPNVVHPGGSVATDTIYGPGTTTESPASGSPDAKKAANLVQVTSPFVGTFYRSPAPDADPFVETGKRVKKGETLCIVEAMKLMNEIEAECDGIVKEILIQNATPVEYGETLFVIERS